MSSESEALRTVLEFLHPGDVLMVTRIDRLARSIGDLQDIVRTVRAKGASLKATERPIDTGTAAVRDEPPTRAPARGYRQGQSHRRLQGPAAFDRGRAGA